MLFASVDRAAFCLMTTTAQCDAIEAVYRPAERTLLAARVRDFQFILVELTQRAPDHAKALAVAERGQLRLTTRAKRC